MQLRVIEVAPEYIGRDLVLTEDENRRTYFVDPRIDFAEGDAPPIEDFVGKTIEVDALQGYIWLGKNVRIIES